MSVSIRWGSGPNNRLNLGCHQRRGAAVECEEGGRSNERIPAVTTGKTHSDMLSLHTGRGKPAQSGQRAARMKQHAVLRVIPVGHQKTVVSDLTHHRAALTNVWDASQSDSPVRPNMPAKLSGSEIASSSRARRPLLSHTSIHSTLATSTHSTHTHTRSAPPSPLLHVAARSTSLAAFLGVCETA
jgi:hypothetical protein